MRVKRGVSPSIVRVREKRDTQPKRENKEISTQQQVRLSECYFKTGQHREKNRTIHIPS